MKGASGEGVHTYFYEDDQDNIIYKGKVADNH